MCPKGLQSTKQESPKSEEQHKEHLSWVCRREKGRLLLRGSALLPRGGWSWLQEEEGEGRSLLDQSCSLDVGPGQNLGTNY